jgi:hypothetical protein
MLSSDVWLRRVSANPQAFPNGTDRVRQITKIDRPRHDPNATTLSCTARRGLDKNCENNPMQS